MHGLAERLSMTTAELGLRMSGAEITERRALDDVLAAEQERQIEKQNRKKR